MPNYSSVAVTDPLSGIYLMIQREYNIWLFHLGHNYCCSVCFHAEVYDMFWLDSSNTVVTFQKGFFRSPLMLVSGFDLWPQQRTARASLMFCENTNVLRTVWPLEAAGQTQSDKRFQRLCHPERCFGPFGSSGSASVWDLWGFQRFCCPKHCYGLAVQEGLVYCRCRWEGNTNGCLRW